MAVTPLFVSSRASLLANLRLSSTASSSDVATIIDQTTRKVRVGLYRELDSAVMTTLLATISVDNPTTAAQRNRALAEQVEIAWIRLELLRTLPVLFRDSAAGSLQDWNQEALTREGPAGGSNLGEEIARLEKEVTEGIAMLNGDADEPRHIRTVLIEPDTTPPRPGTSLGLPWTRPEEEESAWIA